MSRYLFLVVLGIVAFILMYASETNASTLIPCTDARGCPDLQIDPNPYGLGFDISTNIETWTNTDCAVQEGMVTAGTRTLVRFHTRQANHGLGRVHLGRPEEHPEYFTLSNCHGHYHFTDSAAYRVWTQRGYARWQALRAANPNIASETLLATHPNIDSKMRAGHKQGFCMEETSYYPNYDFYYNDPIFGPSYYHSCDDQGINPEAADDYGYSLDGQWVDITGLPKGTYVLEQETNPYRLIQETDYSNNTAVETFTIGNVSAHAPHNDNWQHASQLAIGDSLTGNNAAATVEAGEAQSWCGYQNGNSVWYRISFPTDTPITIDTVGSSISTDTVLSVRTGSSLATLAEVPQNRPNEEPYVCNDDGYGLELKSRVSWVALGRVTYYIQLSSYGSLTDSRSAGPFVINVK